MIRKVTELQPWMNPVIWPRSEPSCIGLLHWRHPYRNWRFPFSNKQPALPRHPSAVPQYAWSRILHQRRLHHLILIVELPTHTLPTFLHFQMLSCMAWIHLLMNKYLWRTHQEVHTVQSLEMLHPTKLSPCLHQATFLASEETNLNR